MEAEQVVGDEEKQDRYTETITWVCQPYSAIQALHQGMSKRYDIAEFLASDWCSRCHLVIGQGYAVGCHPSTLRDRASLNVFGPGACFTHALFMHDSQLVLRVP